MAPVSAERCVAGRDLTEPRLNPDGTILGYVVADDGTAGIVLHPLDGSMGVHLATTPALRPGRGFGGGAWCWSAAGDAVIYVAGDGNLWRQPLNGHPPRQLTEHGPDRTASGPNVAPDGERVVYAVDQQEVWVVTITTGLLRRLDDASDDFCLDPCALPDGRGAMWLTWNRPDMPWDHACVKGATFDGSPIETTVPPCSIQQPRMLADGTPIWLRDDHGWLNIWVGDRPLVDEPFEHGAPTWGPGQRSFAWSPDGTRIAFTRNEHGFGRLCVVDVGGRQARDVARGVHGQLSWSGGTLAAVRSGARTPTEVVCYDTDTWARTVVDVGPAGEWGADELVEPELVEVDAGDATLHGRLYRPVVTSNRLIVWLHGGPTDQWQVTFMPRILYWRSRGWNVLVPDHRGSTGHGRDYQQALRGRWGELDVADTRAFVIHAQLAGWGSPGTTVLMGSSAGGFTALALVAADPARFAAAVLLYPVTSLAELSEHSHRYERHYTFSLVGPLPEASELYRQRSPAMHPERYTGIRLLILHGDVDPVVPVEQSRVFVDRVRAAGGHVELHVYEGEGHGFRQTANQLDEYRRVEEFLARTVSAASPVAFEG